MSKRSFEPVFVIDAEKTPLEPCHPAVARRLLKSGQAAVFKTYPFTIILKRRIEDPQTDERLLCVDPGSKITGMALVNRRTNQIERVFEIEHRHLSIKDGLDTRKGYRRSRRHRHCRYREARWQHRKRAVAMPHLEGNRICWTYQRISVKNAKRGYGDGKGWIAPSLMSRVFNITTWANRLRAVCPIRGFVLENVKFDTQLMRNPDIKGVAYQRGTLWHTELREYVFHRDKHRCRYCGTKKGPFNTDHVIPESKGGPTRHDNLVTACIPCNRKKDNKLPDELTGEMGEVARKIVNDGIPILKDAAAVNTIRWKIFEALQTTGLPVHCVTGGQTKFNRTRAGLPKTHYYDAACTCGTPAPVKGLRVMRIKALGYGTRDLFSFRSPFPKNQNMDADARKAWRAELDAKRSKTRERMEKKLKTAKTPEKRREILAAQEKNPNANWTLFNYGKRKRIERMGFKKLDHVEGMKSYQGKTTRVTGTINCFDNTPTQTVRVKFGLESKARKPFKTSELRRIQHRDGYAYFYEAAAPQKHLARPAPETAQQADVTQISSGAALSPTLTPLSETTRGGKLIVLPQTKRRRQKAVDVSQLRLW